VSIDPLFANSTNPNPKKRERGGGRSTLTHKPQTAVTNTLPELGAGKPNKSVVYSSSHICPGQDTAPTEPSKIRIDGIKTKYSREK